MDPLAETVLYPEGVRSRLYLNRFRGEPAISRFDWPFTPSHKSSANFFNISRFGPPVSVTQPSTCPWLDHRVSGLYLATTRPVKTRFPTAPFIQLTLLQNISR